MAALDGIKRIAVYLFIVFSLMLVRPDAPCAAAPTSQDEAAACLECHSKPGIMVTFQNRDTLEALVDANKFKASVHASLPCSSCHTDFAPNNHPQRSFRSREQYALKSSLVCRQCHADEQIKKSKVHASLLDKSDSTPVCTGCHSAHAITALSSSRKFSTEKQYCLGCHKHSLHMTFKNGEIKPLSVDSSHLDNSVHAKLSCFDCHVGFSTSEHPKRFFKDGRNFTITHSDACRRCHFDKYTKTIESTHFTTLSQGNLKAPVCTDCHGSHQILRARVDKSVGAKRCGNCHRDVYSMYASSVHGSALLNQHNTDVPMCVDCHSAHTIENTHISDYRDRVPEICGRCHANKDIMKKYGLSTGVVNSYLQDFHGITLKFYKQQKNQPESMKRKSIATCTDCHGIHDITKAGGANAMAVKTKLVKRCQRCHAGATDSFPDAWLSHYEPSLTNAPLVFAINLTYKFFIPFMLIGLILQILLHVWRYVMNR
jgi:hypothetical protein